MEWTKESPTKEGHYWYYDPQADDPLRIILAYDYCGDLHIDEWDTYYFPSDYKGYWYGPITPPALPQE